MPNRIHDIIPDPPGNTISSGARVVLKIDYSCDLAGATLCVGPSSTGFDVTLGCQHAALGQHMKVDLPVTITRTTSTSPVCTLHVDLRLEPAVLNIGLEHFVVT